MLGCCPGGAFSNIYCFVLRADLDLSVAMSTASSFVACMSLPVNIWIYTTVLPLTTLDDAIEIDFVGVVIAASAVIVGTLGGILIQRRSRRLAVVAAKVGSWSAFIIYAVSLFFNAGSETPVWATGSVNYVAPHLRLPARRRPGLRPASAQAVARGARGGAVLPEPGAAPPPPCALRSAACTSICVHCSCSFPTPSPLCGCHARCCASPSCGSTSPAPPTAACSTR